MSQVSMGTNIRTVDSSTSIIAVTGAVTAACEGALMEAYGQAAGSTVKHVLLDFRELEYLNSSGIGLIVTLLVRANRQGQKLAAFGLSDHYRHIFELTRLSDAIAIHDGEQTALRAVAL
jgi:anti-anti-sigma factor